MSDQKKNRKRTISRKEIYESVKDGRTKSKISMTITRMPIIPIAKDMTNPHLINYIYDADEFLEIAINRKKNAKTESSDDLYRMMIKAVKDKYPELE